MPLVAADSPAARGLLTHGTHGFRVPSGPTIMADTLAKLADNRELAARMGAAARVRSEEFHPALFAQELVGHYRILLNHLEPAAVVERRAPWFDDLPTQLKLEI